MSYSRVSAKQGASNFCWCLQHCLPPLCTGAPRLPEATEPVLAYDVYVQWQPLPGAPRTRSTACARSKAGSRPCPFKPSNCLQDIASRCAARSARMLVLARGERSTTPASPCRQAHRLAPFFACPSSSDEDEDSSSSSSSVTSSSASSLSDDPPAAQKRDDACAVTEPGHQPRAVPQITQRGRGAIGARRTIFAGRTG